MGFFQFRHFRTKVMFFWILAAVIIAATSNLLIQRYALRSQFEQLRNRLMIIAQIAASTVDVEKLIRIPLDKDGVNSEAYSSVAEKLQSIKDIVPGLKYFYILKKTSRPGMLEFVVDVQSKTDQNSVDKSYPGDPYDARHFPEMLKAFQGPAADRKLTADQWGVSLSGYAPIRGKDEKVIAILGVDMTAQEVYAIQKDVIRHTVFILGFGVLLAMIVGFIVSGGLSRQVAGLVKGAQRVAKGDLDYKVRINGADEIARLAGLFNQMSQDLKIHIQDLQRTTAEKERLVRDLEIAREIQQSFLPDSVPKIDGFQIAALNLPARTVSGDFYDFIPIEKNKWGVVISDVSGKGVPAALFMALSRTLVRASTGAASSPAEALNQVNTLLLKDSKTSMFVTIFYGIIDASNMSLEYANAGHNPPFLVGDSQSNIIFLKTQSVPLGITQDLGIDNAQLKLKKHDIVVLYTDGVTEALNKKKEQFGADRLISLVQARRSLSAEELMDEINKEVRMFVQDEPQFDDITVMVIKVV